MTIVDIVIEARKASLIPGMKVKVEGEEDFLRYYYETVMEGLGYVAEYAAAITRLARFPRR